MNKIEQFIQELQDEGYPSMVVIEDTMEQEENINRKYSAYIVDKETNNILLDRNGDYTLIAYGKTISGALASLEQKIG